MCLDHLRSLKPQAPWPPGQATRAATPSAASLWAATNPRQRGRKSRLHHLDLSHGMPWDGTSANKTHLPKFGLAHFDSAVVARMLQNHEKMHCRFQKNVSPCATRSGQHAQTWSTTGWWLTLYVHRKIVRKLDKLCWAAIEKLLWEYGRIIAIIEEEFLGAGNEHF